MATSAGENEIVKRRGKQAQLNFADDQQRALGISNISYSTQKSNTRLMKLSGGLQKNPGVQEVTLIGDGKMAATTYSSFKFPW